MRRIACLVLLLPLLPAFAAEAVARGGAWRGPPSPPGVVPAVCGTGLVQPASESLGVVRIPLLPLPEEDWLCWWTWNREPFLLGAPEMPVDPERIPPPLDPAVLSESVVPALVAAAKNRALPLDVQGAAILALARGRRWDHSALLLGFLNDPKAPSVVRETAAVALGLAGPLAEGPREGLIRAVDDLRSGRRGVFAGLALGLAEDADPRSLAALLRRANHREIPPEQRAAAWFAIGLLGRAEAVPALVDRLGDMRYGGRRPSKEERPFLVSALGRLGDPDALPEVLRQLGSNDAGVARAAYMAATRLLPAAPESAEQARALHRWLLALDRERDDVARRCGILGLGRIAGAAGATDAVRRTCRDRLDKTLRRSRGEDLRFAILALGLVGAGSAPPDPRETAAIGDRLLPYLESSETIGPALLALGLLGDRRPQVVERLLAVIGDSGVLGERRAAATAALTLLGEARGRDAILAALRAGGRTAADVEAAFTLARRRDGGAGSALFLRMQDASSSLHARAAAARAIGEIGDPESVEPLLRFLKGEGLPDENPAWVQAWAAAALGRLLEGSPAGRLGRAAADVDAWGATPDLLEFFSLL